MSHVSARLQQAITPSVCTQLTRLGYAVVDNVFGKQTTSSFRDEIRNAQPHMRLNCTHLVKDNQLELLQKQHIYEAELSLEQKVQESCEELAALNHDTTLMTMINLFLPRLSLGLQVSDRHCSCPLATPPLSPLPLY